MPDHLQLIQLHLADLELAGSRPSTIRSKSHVLRMLAHFMTKDLSVAERHDVTAFLTRPELSSNSRSIYLTHIRTFYTWAVDEGYIVNNPTIKLRGPKVRRGLPRPMPLADYQRAVRLADGNVRIWLLLGGQAGLRCCEMAELRGVDIDLEAPVPLMRVNGKGGKAGAVPLHPDLVNELRPRIARRSEEWLFPHRHHEGRHILASSVSTMLNLHLHKLGIASTAHSTRHLFGTYFYRGSGNDIRMTQDALRHASPVTTALYTKVDPVASAAVVSSLDYFTERAG